MAANDYLALPSAAAGLSLASAASSWGYSSYGTIVSSGNNTTGLMITQVNIRPDMASAGVTNDITWEGVLELYSGPSDTLIAQIPFTWRTDTKVAHGHQSHTIVMPEPIEVESGVQVRARVADSSTSALTHNGIKVFYRQPNPSVEQEGFRFYADGTETGSSALAAQNTNYTADVSSGDVNLGLRVRLQNNGDSLYSTDDYQLQYELNDSGAYSNVDSGATLNNTGSFSGNGTSTVNTSFTVNSGSNRLLVVILALTNTVTSFTYNGVALTNATANGSRDIWYLVNPSTGSNTLSLTVSGITAASSTSAIAAFNGVLQTSPLDVGTTNSGASGTGVSKSITLALNGSLLIDAGWANGTGGTLGSLTANNSQNSLTYGNGGDDQAKAGYLLSEASGTRTYGYTAGADSIWGYRVAVFKAAIPVISYNSASLTDGNATTNRLSPGGVIIQSDDFDDNSIDSAKWTNWGGANVTETSGQLQIVTGTGSGLAYGVDTANRADFRDAYAQIQVVDDGTPRVNGQVIPIQITQSSGNAVYWFIENGTAYCYKAVASVYTQVGSSRTHTDNDYYRVREENGTTYWDYSADGVVWVNQTSQANPIDLSHVAVTINTYNNAVVTSTTAKFDNFQMGSGNFQAGEISEDGLVDDFKLTANNFTEHLYSLTIDSDAVADNDTIDFRVLRNGSILETYTVTPRITIEETAGATIIGSDVAVGTTIDATTITQNHVISPADIALALTADTTTITQNHVLSPADVALATSEDTTSIIENYTVTPADVALALAEDATTIAQNHIIAPQDASVATTADNTTISQDHVVAAQDVALVLTEDNTTISQNHVVVPQDASLALSADSTTITQDHVVVPQDAAVTLTEDAATITQDHVISPADASLSTTIDNTTVAENFVLSTADIALALSEDAATISQDHSLAPADLSVGLSEDAATISQAHLLSPADVLLSTTEDNATITQLHVIVPQDAALGLSADSTTIIENYTFSPNDLLVALSEDAATITQNHVVAVQDVALGLTIDATTIDLSVLIQAADIALSLSADNTTISQDHVISAQDVALALTADNAAISQNHILSLQDVQLSLTVDATTVEETSTVIVAQDISLSLTEDATAISQNHVISAADIALALATDNTAITQNHVIAPQDAQLSVSLDNASVVQNHVLAVQDVLLSLTEDGSTISQVHVLNVNDLGILLSVDSTSVDDGTAQLRRIWIDLDGNVYYVISQTAGLIERI